MRKKLLVPVLIILCAAAVTACNTKTIKVPPTFCTVAFYSGDSVYRSQEVVKGKKAVEPVSPEVLGKAFTGWYTAEGGNVLYDFDDAVTTDLTLYAGWRDDAPAPRYTLAFDPAGGSAVLPQTPEAGKAPVEPKAPQKKNYDFVGWYTEEDGGGELFRFDRPLDKNVTIFACWQRSTVLYTVVFDSNGGTDVPSQTVPADGRLMEPKDPYRENYIFEGWFTDDGASFSFATRVVMDMTLTAGWTRLFTVGFSDGIASQTVKEGDTARRPPLDPVVEGKKFMYWALDGQRYEFDSAVTKDINLTAVFEALIEVAFDTGGGSAVPAQYLGAGEVPQRPADPVRQGYNFKGWLDGEGKIYNFDTAVGADIILTADWAQLFTVTFDFGYDGRTKSVAVESGSTVSAPEIVREGYTLTGWELDGEIFDFDGKITKDIVLTAVWNDKVIVGLIYTLNDTRDGYIVSAPEDAEGMFSILAEINGLPVTEIAGRAFFGSGITRVDIPDSVVRIGNLAFMNCRKLKELNLPASLTYLGEGSGTAIAKAQSTFMNCSSIETVVVGCAALLPDWAFAGCTALKSVSFNGNGKYSVPQSAFYNCGELSSVYFAEGLTSIDKNAFSGCVGLRSVALPASLAAIGNTAFNNTSLTKIEMAGAVPPVLANANNSLPKANKFIVYVPAGALDAYKTAWSAVSDFIMEGPPQSDFVTETTSGGIVLKKYTGGGVRAVVPEGVTEIAEGAFTKTAVHTVVLPRTLNKVNAKAFADCPLVIAEFTAAEAPAIMGDGFTGSTTGIVNAGFPMQPNTTSGKNYFVFVVPDGSLESYKKGMLKYYAGYTPEGVLISDSGTVKGYPEYYTLCNIVEKSQIVDDRFIIEDNTLIRYLGTDSELDLNADAPKIEAVGAKAFLGNVWLTKLTMPSAAYSIGYKAFAWCGALKEVLLGGASTALTANESSYANVSYAFINCKKLESVELGALTAVPAYMFNNCEALTAIDLTGVKWVGTYAFYSCKALTRLILPASLDGDGADGVALGASAFGYCTALNSVVCRITGSAGSPAYLDSAFASSGTVTRFVFENSVNVRIKTGGSKFFSPFSQLKALYLPQGVYFDTLPFDANNAGLKVYTQYSEEQAANAFLSGWDSVLSQPPVYSAQRPEGL